MSQKVKPGQNSRQTNGENSDEEYEILDVTERRIMSSFDKALDKVFGDVTKASAAKQLCVGGGTGWLAGFLCVKVGKAAAVTIGVTALAFQLAAHNGLITVNWTKVNRIVNQAQQQAQRHIENQRSTYIQKVHTFYKENFFLAVGFSGGFLTGFFF